LGTNQGARKHRRTPRQIGAHQWEQSFRKHALCLRPCSCRLYRDLPTTDDHISTTNVRNAVTKPATVTHPVPSILKHERACQMSPTDCDTPSRGSGAALSLSLTWLRYPVKTNCKSQIYCHRATTKQPKLY